jgi:hypothetical protein
MECHVELVGKKRKAYRNLVRKPKGKRLLRKRREDNTKMDLKQAGGVWTGFIWLRI